jgi:hypothetical protein
VLLACGLGEMVWLATMYAKEEHDLYEYFFSCWEEGRILLITKCMVVVLYTHSHALIYFQSFTPFCFAYED